MVFVFLILGLIWMVGKMSLMFKGATVKRPNRQSDNNMGKNYNQKSQMATLYKIAVTHARSTSVDGEVRKERSK